MRLLNVAVGVLINAQQEIFVALREVDADGELWEFPGGKLEPGESALDALRRELHEEIDITVDVATPFLELEHSYSDRRVHLSVWCVESYHGEPTGKEGQRISWVGLSALQQLRLPGANQPIVDAIAKLLVN